MATELFSIPIFLSTFVSNDYPHHMKTISFVLTTALVLFTSCNFFAQSFKNPIVGASRIVANTKYVGVLGNKEILTNITNGGFHYNYNLLVYEDGKQLDKDRIQISYNNEKYVPSGYFTRKDIIIGYFIAGSKNSDDVSFCIQEFNGNLEQIGSPKEIITLPKAVDPTKLLDSKSGGLFNDIAVKEQNIEALYNYETGTMLFTFSLQLNKSYGVSYAKAFIIDKEYNVINSYEYKSSTSENYVKARPLKIYKNNDAVLSLTEGKDEKDLKNGYYFNISNSFLLLVSGSNKTSKELELLPDQREVVQSKVCENLDKDGSLVYGIQSRLPNNSEKDGKIFMGLYRFNPITQKLKRNSISFSIDDAFPNNKVSSFFYDHFRIKKVFNLDDGSIILLFSGEGYQITHGHFFVKVNKNNQIDWVKGFYMRAELNYTR